MDKCTRGKAIRTKEIQTPSRLSHSAEKIRSRILLCFRNFMGSKNFMHITISVDNFLSHSTEKFSRESLLCFKKFVLLSKNLMHKKGELSRLSVEKFLSHNTERFCRGTLHCFRNFWCREILWMREEGGSTFPVENFLYYSTEKFRRGTLPSFRKILVSKIFMHKRAGGVSRFFVVLIKLKNIGKDWCSNPYHDFSSC